MNILRDSQLVIFSHNTTFMTFSCKSLGGFLFKFLQSSRLQKSEGRWIFAFDPSVLDAYIAHFQKEWKPGQE